jgi:hypothetical protein
MKIEAPPKIENKDLHDWLYNLWIKLQDDHFYASEVWNPGNVADGEMVSNDVTVTGAVLGDFAIASFSLDVADLVLDAQVTAANTVTVTLTNDGIGAGVDLTEGTVYVRVFRKVI